MLTSIATLALMLLLARLPLNPSFFGSGGAYAYVAPPDLSDRLALVTAHEIRSAAPERPVERFLPNDVLPESDLMVDELTKTETAGHRTARARAAPRRAAASLTLHDLARTTQFMHTALSAPVVEEPPVLRISTLLIEYPFSALKKAIEGLVIVRFTVEPDGRAYGIDVVRSLEPACDAAVVRALRRAHFVPGRSRGRNVPALSQIAVHFRIEERSRHY